ncbi:D-alanyl-D-alanine carboxypeptidase [Actinorhabdospora filicis]|uniref:D-alanyl-D-alanine carboxypeptidase n=1 Tax=Actinorhabdospora filicis TaxID=1785913 RepID=A0A9W6SHG6_9ACTN|nr:D-alanyl-D-alanine carboxypeptidase/D-alanyl-D-alanine-endopeptidase [Actinorhabdospora filicis]GLZ77200.1 D-alanyl-D-alanine carboxypeptidase [Actinorhabdospora filicis]
MTLLLSACTQSDATGTITFEAEPGPAAALNPPSGTDKPTKDGIGAALAPAMTSIGFDAAVVGLAVHDAATGELLYGSGDGVPLIPGSTNKIAIASAILATRGPDYRIPTRVVKGANPGEVVLIGQGDPTLSADGNGYYPGSASLTDLAGQVKKALGDQQITTVTFDTSAFSGDGLAPGVDPLDVTAGWTAPATALMTNGARITVNPGDGTAGAQRHDAGVPRFDDPAAATAKIFATALGAQARIQPGRADPSAQELGVVHSPPMRRLIEETVMASDNIVADMLLKQIALAKGLPGSFQDGANAVARVFGELGLPAEQIHIVDGSGLSYDNKVTAGFLSALLAKAAGPGHPELRPVFAALPVAGYTGTLDQRYGHEQTLGGKGLVRAKTGTLAEVSALAGSVLDAGGRELTFAVLVNKRGNMFEAQHTLDRIATALAGCGCR